MSDEENNTDTEFDPAELEKYMTEDNTKSTLTLNCVENPDTLSCDFKKKDNEGKAYDYNVELDKNNFYLEFWDPNRKAIYFYNPLTGHATWINPNQQQKKQSLPRAYIDEVKRMNKQIDEAEKNKSNSSSLASSSLASSQASSPDLSSRSEGGKKTKRTKRTKRTKTKRTKRTKRNK